VFDLYTNTNQKNNLFVVLHNSFEGETFPIFIWNWFLGEFGKQLLAQESWER